MRKANGDHSRNTSPHLTAAAQDALPTQEPKQEPRPPQMQSEFAELPSLTLGAWTVHATASSGGLHPESIRLTIFNSSGTSSLDLFAGLSALGEVPTAFFFSGILFSRLILPFVR
jgi:hypothetical protein